MRAVQGNKQAVPLVVVVVIVSWHYHPPPLSGLYSPAELQNKENSIKIHPYVIKSGLVTNGSRNIGLLDLQIKTEFPYVPISYPRGSLLWEVLIV